MTDEEFYELKANTEEEWRQVILNHELQDYDISNIGRIRRHDSKALLKPSKTKGMTNAYEFINLTLRNGKKYNTSIHRLIAIMFIPIPKKYLKYSMNNRSLVVDHIDNVKYHNIVNNLQWLTNNENHRKWLQSISDLNDFYLTEESIRQICEELQNGIPISVVAHDLNVTELTVYNIRYGLAWQHISKEYTFPSKRTPETTVRLICEYLSKGYGVKRTAKLVDVSTAVVGHILAGDSWVNISSEYNLPKKLTSDEDVIKACELMQEGKSLKETSKLTGISKRVLERIRRGDTYTHISKNYKFVYSKYKLPDSVIHNICKELQEKKKYMKDIAKDNGVSTTFVKGIKYGKHRTDISQLYTW